MKITESKLRKIIRGVLYELTGTATALGGAKKKGYESPERKEKKATVDKKKTTVTTKKTTYDTKKSDYDTKKSDYDTKKSAQDASKAATNYDTKKSALVSATNTYNTKDAALKTHLGNEPTKTAKSYTWTNTADGKKYQSSKNPGSLGGWEVGGKTEFTYTNTVTGKKVTGTSDPGTMGEYTIPAIGGAAELKVTSTHYFPEEGTEIKSKATKVKGPKEMITQIQSDIDKWTKFEKDIIGTLPKGFKDVINNMKATLNTIQGRPQLSFEYYSPGDPKAFQAAKTAPQQGKGSAIKAGEGGKDEKKFGTQKQYLDDRKAYEKKVEDV